MPCSASYEVMPNVTFGVDSWSVSTMCGPCVIVPIRHVEMMTNEQIGEAVRQLVPKALYASALEIAENIVCNATGQRNHDWLLSEEYTENRVLLESFAGRGGYIDKALGFIHGAEAKQLARESQAKRYKHGKLSPAQVIRQEVRSQYDKLFMKLGKQYGFHCQQCQGTFNLHIDHKVAVANGGTNDLDNLQLLCETCNGTKSDRE